MTLLVSVFLTRGSIFFLVLLVYSEKSDGNIGCTDIPSLLLCELLEAVLDGSWILFVLVIFGVGKLG